MPKRQRKRQRLAKLEGTSENGCARRRAEHKDHVWSYDFVMDCTEDGRRLKMMPVVDEHTRECLTIKVERSITAEDVVSSLARLFDQRGASAFVRSDNGPEFIARVLKRWLALSDVETLYIEPGSPWENAYAESFIGRFGDKLLKREVFTGLVEAKVLVEEYREHHNHRRPHSSLGYLNTGGVCGEVRAERRRRRPYEGTRIDNRTLIAAGSENGGRPSFSSPPLLSSCRSANRETPSSPCTSVTCYQPIG